jgi:hypothetical protein
LYYIYIYIYKLIVGPRFFRSAHAKERKALNDIKRQMKLIASLSSAQSGMYKFNHKKNIFSDTWIQVTFSCFNFENAVKSPLAVFKSGLLPRSNADPIITWDDGKSRIAKSEDGVNLVLHVPNFLRSGKHVSFLF